MDEYNDLRKRFGYGDNLFAYYLQGVKDVLRYWLFGSECRLPFEFLKLFPRQRQLAVCKDTEVTIEGFPGSGNSFAVEAFKWAQERNVKIAHHLHLPCQVLRSVEWNIPTLVLVRNPIDAIVSVVSRTAISRYSYFYASPALLLRYYITFYQTIKPVLHFAVIADFEEVTKNFGKVVERLNARTGSSFRLFEHTEEKVRRILESEDLRLARPMEFRQKEKYEVRQRLLKDKSCRELLEKSLETYRMARENRAE